MRISINQAACQGDCICSVICPEVFVLDDAGIAWAAENGVPLARGGSDSFANVPSEHRDDVLDAVGQCPTQCITLLDS